MDRAERIEETRNDMIHAASPLESHVDGVLSCHHTLRDALVEMVHEMEEADLIRWQDALRSSRLYGDLVLREVAWSFLDALLYKHICEGSPCGDVE